MARRSPLIPPTHEEDELKTVQGQGVRVLQAFLNEPPLLTPEEGRALDRIIWEERLRSMETFRLDGEEENEADDLPA